MCVVAECGAVGIDVERLRAWEELADMASMVGDSSPDDARELLSLWTRKEALAKALGTGLPDDVRSLAVPSRTPARDTWIRSNGWLWIGCPSEDGSVSALVLKHLGPDAYGTVGLTETRTDQSGVRAWSLVLRP